MGCRQPVLSLPSKPSPPLPPLFLQRQEFSTTEVSPARQDVRILCTLPPALLPDWIPRGAMPADVTQGRLSHTTAGDTVLLGCWQRSLWWSHHSPIQGSASQPTQLWGSNGEAIKQNWGTLSTCIFGLHYFWLYHPRANVRSESWVLQKEQQELTTLKEIHGYNLHVYKKCLWSLRPSI